MVQTNYTNTTRTGALSAKTLKELKSFLFCEKTLSAFGLDAKPQKQKMFLIFLVLRGKSS